MWLNAFVSDCGDIPVYTGTHINLDDAKIKNNFAKTKQGNPLL